MAHLAAVLGAIGAPLVLDPPEPPGAHPRRPRPDRARRGRARRLRSSGPLRLPRGARARRADRRWPLCGYVFVRRPELVPLAIADRRTAADAARLRRRAPLLHRPPAGRRDRPPAAALRHRSRRRPLALAWQLVRERETALPLPPARSRSRSAAFVVVRVALGAVVVGGRVRRRTCSQCFLLPFAVLVAVVARAPFPAWMPRAMADRRRRARSASSPRSASSRRRRTGSSSTRPPSRSGTRTRASSASPRSSATRACTAATSCSAIAIVLTVAWYRKLGIALATADRRLPLRGPLLLLLAVEPRGAVRSRRVHLGRGGRPRRPHRRGRHRRARPRRRRRLRRRQGRGRFDATGDERPLAAHRPDGEGVQAAPARGRRPRLAAAGEPGGLEERRPADPASSRTRRRSRSLPSSASSGSRSTRRCSSAPARRCCACSGIDQAFGLALAAVFVALFVHSLFYSGFFEDPVTWLVLGVTSSFLAAQAPAPSARVTA